MLTRILVVDDEKNILALFKKMLNADAFKTMGESYDTVEVETALNGEEALLHIQSGHFDLVISDLAMEGMNGIDLLERVKSLNPDLPFMILTGVGTIEDAVRSMKLGAYDYLTKPFQHDELLLSIRKALDYGRLHTEVKTLRQKLLSGQNGGASKILSDGYINDLLSRNWPGSIQDLEHVIENAVARAQDHKESQDAITIPKRAASKGANGEKTFGFSSEQTARIEDCVRRSIQLKSILDEFAGALEKIVITKILSETMNNKAEAARRLGISRPALYKKIKDHNIE